MCTLQWASVASGLSQSSQRQVSFRCLWTRWCRQQYFGSCMNTHIFVHVVRANAKHLLHVAAVKHGPSRVRHRSASPSPTRPTPQRGKLATNVHVSHNSNLTASDHNWPSHKITSGTRRPIHKPAVDQNCKQLRTTTQNKTTSWTGPSRAAVN